MKINKKNLHFFQILKEINFLKKWLFQIYYYYKKIKNNSIYNKNNKLLNYFFYLLLN